MPVPSEEQNRCARPRAESTPSSLYRHPRTRPPAYISPLTLISPDADPPPTYTTATGHVPLTASARGSRSSDRSRQHSSPGSLSSSRRVPRNTRSRQSSSNQDARAVTRSLSSPFLHTAYALCALSVGMSMGTSVTYPQQPPPYPWSSSEDDDSVTETEQRQRAREADGHSPWGASTGNGVRHRKSTSGVRARGGYGVLKNNTTVPGQGAGETETEGDDSSHLPNTRILTSSNTSSTPLEILYEIACWLSIVPAVFGTVWNFLHAVGLIEFAGGGGPKRVDHGVAMVWAIVTGHLHRALTLHLLTRWRIYYSPLPTLIRLLAFQAICWPATHFTLTLLGHLERPVVCWAVVGSTTAVSRAMAMWVVSNIPGSGGGGGREGRRRRWDARLGVEGLGERKWDWGEVGWRCVLPVGVVYFVMAWAEVIKQEVWGC
ncbi:hypothetical protein OE88DRAFT_1735424 [Heliocybe sulcata]|uniref:Uncharacterized protein n=1 Tax=Heliocybe sulcata TaxID=5364 RepID=A0A5C3N2V3_9AGAM|nr:hypothetical protein OE88DRAFT_1735424 [Heliocybe sulcata]